ncbi:putative bifunctional diguanylate cyclase/phosphodiesterase [Kineobactrum salinum]|uniref:EAL domain-containing protein n=1 Tax=Kineobactrum salinum TaxID=2708301 RepID=A0A6C0U051_9GAMM|nr:EAL domain-containing response regulator [Kineobactrum salinum]QIB64347.1 EAL domain-containing protein [Kineobactrum salinum]
MEFSHSKHGRAADWGHHPLPAGVILAVDDDPGSLLLASEYFGSEGYRVDTALSGDDALARIEQIQPDIILLDIIMPGMDGYEVCRRIRRMPHFKSTPIIILTSLDNSDAEQRAYDIGAWDFVTKPIHWPTLKHRVQFALRASRAMMAERSADRFARVINQSPNEVLIFDSVSLLVLDENVSALRNLGYSKEELKNLSFIQTLHGETPESLESILQQVRLRQQEKFKFQMQRKDGSTYSTEATLLYSVEEDPRVYVAILQDTSEKHRIEEELHRLSFYDELTGLANRRLLEDQAGQLLSMAQRNGHRCAVCILDLDGIRHINDALGPAVGDLLLQQISQRLADVVRRFDLIARDESSSPANSGTQLARFGGDEFVLVLSDFDNPLDPAKAAERILEAVALPCLIQDNQLSLTASMGISLYPDDGDNLDELVQRAHTAMYAAKRAGKNRYSFFTEENNRNLISRMQLEAELRAAIENEEFELHYQPLVDTALQRVTGAECLLRWRHPDGMRFPDQFIPLAEETGLILPIGEWVLRETVAQLNRWADVIGEDFGLSVNISSLQIREQRFLERTRELLKANPIADGHLIFELTESSLIEDVEGTIRWLRDIESLGIRIAIDDFGTGYSSLNYLVRLPVYCIKIDRVFVNNVDHDRDQAAIVLAIFQMARALRIEVVVEGVETREQLATLTAMGSCGIQGWLVSKALPVDRFEQFLQEFPPSELPAPAL